MAAKRTQRAGPSPAPGRMTTAHELFCAHVASGMNSVDAALSAGFSRHSAHDLCERFKDHIAQLRAIKAQQPPDSIASQAWIETQLVGIYNACAYPPDTEQEIETVKDGKLVMEVKVRPGKPDWSQARLALMNLAEVKGYLVKKSDLVPRTINFHSLSPAQLREQLNLMMGSLSPEQQSTVRALAAGEIDISAVEVPEEPQ